MWINVDIVDETWMSGTFLRKAPRRGGSESQGERRRARAIQNLAEGGGGFGMGASLRL